MECFWFISLIIEEFVKNPSNKFSGPLFILYDCLLNKSPLIKSLGENWFRSYMKNHSKALNPLFSIILNKQIVIDRKTILINSKSPCFNHKKQSIIDLISTDQDSTQSFQVQVNYLTPVYGFNNGQVLYAFESISGFIKIGDGVMIKSLWMNQIDLEYKFDWNTSMLMLT